MSICGGGELNRSGAQSSALGAHNANNISTGFSENKVTTPIPGKRGGDFGDVGSTFSGVVSLVS